jgi:acetoin utilization deacetylase AcuC-like enzyme
MTLLYRDPCFLRHDTGLHPERSDRLRAIEARLQAEGLLDACVSRPCVALDPAELSPLHLPEVAQRVQWLCEHGGGRLEADTVVSPESYQVALTAAGTCCAAVEAVLDGSDRTALCLVRPPGHHATAHQSMGFCLFNSIALAAQRALNRGVARVLIVDWDVHHGNGTQDIFYAEQRVCFLSIHRFGRGFYPGSGAASETGTGAGLGYTHNVPVPLGISRTDFYTALENALHTATRTFKPELVLLSAGFDAHHADPVGGLSLEVEDYAPLTQLLRQVANTHCDGRLVSCLEGGYDLEALAGGVAVHLRGLFAGEKPS